MLGWIRWSGDKRLRLARERVFGMTLLTLYLPRRERGRERRVKKGALLLAENRATRVLTPPEFELWPLLLEYGLRPVETVGLRCALAVPWVMEGLRRQGIAPERATVCLCGSRETPELVLTAFRLCPVVRNLVVDVPKGGALAERMRRQFGLPVLPPGSVRADLTLRFSEGPLLENARFLWTGGTLPADCEILPMLSALWQCGRVRAEDIRISVDFP